MFYKYLPPNRVQVLKNLEIRFSQPRALNDPFEGSPLIDMSSSISDLMDQIERYRFDLCENTVGEEKTSENCKILDEEVRSLKSHLLEKMSSSNVGRELMDWLNKRIGILSLSRTFSNLLMWTHYADRHKGFVIGFDESHEFFYQKSYLGLGTCPSQVRYTKQRSAPTLQDFDYYEKLLCEKPIDWAYEEEVRVLRIFTERTKRSPNVDESGYPIYLFDIPKDSIKSIYIGAHAAPNLESEVIDIVHKNGLDAEVYGISISKTRYEIECSKIA